MLTDSADLISTRDISIDSNEPTFAQSASVAVQVALVDQLRSWGLTPSMVVGHSSGEIAAAFCAGKISRQAAWKIAFSRGRVCANRLNRGGAMMAAALSDNEADAFLAKLHQEKPLKVKVGCINSPKSVTFTGNRSDIILVKDSLDAAGILNKILPVKVAYHSSDMEDAAEEYLSLMGDLGFGEKIDADSQVVMISSLAGLPVHNGQVENPLYWVKNLVSPVRFHSALQHSLRLQTAPETAPKNTGSPSGMVIEIGPHSTLKGAVLDALSEHPDFQRIEYCSLLRRGETSRATLLNTLGMLSCQGYPINLDVANDHLLTGPKGHRRILEDIPPYAFDHSQSHRTTTRLVEALKFPPYPRHELLGVPVPDANELEQRWRNFIRLAEIPWLTMNKVTF